MSNRALRHAAERQIRKAGKEQVQQPVASPVPHSEDRQIVSPELPAIVERQRPSRSSGPTSLDWKCISSPNALKHGSCSTSILVLENESFDDFLTLEKRWFQGHAANANNPDTQYEAELIRTAARADWFSQRADRNYAEVEAQVLAAVPNLLMWEDSHHRTLSRFLRYRATHTNTLAKHRKAIENYRKNRASEIARIQKLGTHIFDSSRCGNEWHDTETARPDIRGGSL